MYKRYKLSEYIKKLKALDLLASDPELFSNTTNPCDEIVTKLSFDSRDVDDGTLFFCKGLAFKEEFAKSAKEKGAIAFVSEKKLDIDNLILVKDIRRAMAELSAIFNGYPWNEFPLIGITGTKGKSTTLAFIKSIMDASKKCGEKKFGYISTIDTYDGVNLFKSHLTTPEAIELGTRLRNIADTKLFAAGMEVSSQALKYDRTYGVEFEIGCFTNFGLDHIGESEHKDIEDYLQSKLKLFTQCKNAIVNLDSERIDDILSAAKNVSGKLITISAKDKSADYCISGLRKENGKTVFELGDFGTLSLEMPGMFNAYNAAMAAVCARMLGIENEEIKAGLLVARASGRMEVYENKARELVVISDYAHNALSFESLCKSVREEYPGYRIEAVYGASGGKAFSRRSELPKVAAKYADFSWLTEDDPAFEDPKDICTEMYQNLISFGGKGSIDVDRERTIREAVKKAAPKTVLLLLAKGSDEYMIRGREFVPIKSDSKLAEELTKE